MFVESNVEEQKTMSEPPSVVSAAMNTEIWHFDHERRFR